MRKILAFAVVIVFCLSCATVAFATENNVDDTSTLLTPYLEIIQKINEETGHNICIPEGSEEQVYAYYQNYSLEEFEQELRSDIAQSGTSLTSISDDTEMTTEYFPNAQYS